MAENRKKKDRQKVPWWLTPVILLAVLAIRFGGEAIGRGFQWLSDSQTSESSTTAQKVPSDEALTVRFLDVGQGDSILLSCGEDTMLIDGGSVEEGQFLVSPVEPAGCDGTDLCGQYTPGRGSLRRTGCRAGKIPGGTRLFQCHRVYNKGFFQRG